MPNDADPVNPSERARLFPGNSEMAARIRAFDWSQTDLGPPEGWPQNLRIALSICLASRFPMFLWWGPRLTLFYNDAHIPFLGSVKHPAALGRSGREVWSEIWDTIRPMMEGVFATSTASWSEDILLFFNRHLPKEEVYVTFSYSPVFGRDQQVEGMFCACMETTEKVVGGRRLETLRKLGLEATVARSVEEACRAAAEVLGENSHDLPFAAVYVAAPGGESARLCAAVGLAGGAWLPPPAASIDHGDSQSGLPLATVLQGKRPLDSADLGTQGIRLRDGPWPEPVRQAVVLPIHATAAREGLAGLLLAGVSPRRPLDGAYRTFLDLVAGHLATALANARAYEEERERAEALVELDRAKTAFFSNVSHEFRTPLTLMLGPIQDLLAQAGEALTGSRERFEMVHRNGLRLLRLVNTLLDFSRIEAGRLRASYEPTDLALYTAELAGVFRSAIERAGLTLRVDCPLLGEAVYVDREMWEKVVLNLLSNAFKFTLEGDVAVRLARHEGQVLLTVRDTGCGIPPEELPRVFERFHRVEAARGRTHEGSGIGLALVRELVRLHGGSVQVESELGRGSTFSVRIPLGKDHLPQDRVGARRTPASTALGAQPFVEEALRWLPAMPEAPSGPAIPEGAVPLPGRPEVTTPASASRERVLVADDNADMREYIRRLLSQHYDVEAVADGAQALRAARDRRPAVVLADVMMPNLDGFGLLRALRTEPSLAGLPVVLVSARAGDEATVEGMQAGADDYLVKPFSARELLARVAAQVQRGRLERALAASQARLEEALKAARMAAWEWEPASDRIKTSETAADVYGLLAGDSLRSGAQGFGLVHPEDLERHRAIVLGAAQRGEGYRSEFRIIRPRDGQVAWLEERTSAQWDPVSGALRLIGLAIDITGRKRAELDAALLADVNADLAQVSGLDEAMRLAGEKVSKHLNLSRCLFVEIDHEGEVGTMEHEWRAEGAPALEGTLRLTEWCTEALRQALRAGQTVAVNDVNRDPRTAAFAERYAQVGVGAFLGAPYAREGRWKFMLVGARRAPVRWRGDEIDLMGDLAARLWPRLERARAEQELRKSEERFRHLFELGLIGMAITSPTKGILEVNDQICTILGYGRGELLQKTWAELTHPEDLAADAAQFNRAMAGKIDAYTLEKRWIRKDGAVIYSTISVSCLRRADGSIDYFVALLEDITARKAAEAERGRLLGAERAARQEAEAANRAKDKFLAMLSHELRTPLAAAQMALHLLGDQKPLPAAGRRALELIGRSVEMEAQLIDDLLDVSRIVHGKLALNRVQVDVHACVRQALEFSRGDFEAKGLRPTVVLGAEQSQFRGDATRLKQVFWNLLKNAAKFTPKGGTVTVRSANRADAGEVKLALEVADSGVGIEPEALARIFAPFEQGGNEVTRRHGGLGLGLAICHGIVAAHGGRLTAASAGPNQGATFTVELPLSETSGGALRAVEGK